MKTSPVRMIASATALVASMTLPAARGEDGIRPDEARAIAKEAYLYGYPMVDGYRVLYAYCEDPGNPEFKAPWNELRNIARVFTPEDRAIVAPNSDTPYSMAALLLRDEPFVLTVPQIEKERYFSIQLIDAYTFNFDYIGSRTTGNDGGNFLVAGPGWKGAPPPGITKVIRPETDLMFAVYRTQLFGPADLENVKKVQAGYKVQPLSAFLGQPAPRDTTPVKFMKPLPAGEQKTSLEFFNVLNYVLGFCPTHLSENELMQRFAKIGVGAGKTMNVEGLSPELKKAMADGMADAWTEYAQFLKNDFSTGKVTSGDVFGTREYLKNNYLYRFAAAVIGLYGNSKNEAMYPFYRTDANGKTFDGSKHRYTLRFEPGLLPPAHAFWSITMYDSDSFLVANPLKRYLINSPMLPNLKRDAVGGITLYIQAESPGAEKESNWLPSPNGPFWAAMRIYWPKEAALDGSWKNPQMIAVPSVVPEVLSDGVGAKTKRIKNMHLTRYIEIFLAAKNAEGSVVAACYNTMCMPEGIPASRDTAPQALVEGLDFNQLKEKYGVLVASLNGPKLSTPDWVELEAGVVRDFNGMPAPWVAELKMGSHAGAVTETMKAYTPQTIARDSSIGWNKGTTVVLLDDAAGNTWVMKGFQLGLKPQHTYKEFVSKGATMFKKLPAGWAFRVKTLDQDLIETPEGGVATIMPDEFFNVYDKTGPGMTNYKP